MGEPSIQERALLAAVLEKILVDQDSAKLLASFALQKTDMEMRQTVRALRADREVAYTTVTRNEIEAASLSGLCATLRLVTIDDKNVGRMCEEMRAYLQSEEPCMCQPAEMTDNCRQKVRPNNRLRSQGVSTAS